MTKDDFQRLTPSYNADILLSHLHYLRESKPPSLTGAIAVAMVLADSSF